MMDHFSTMSTLSSLLPSANRLVLTRRAFIFLLIIIVAATPYSYAFASSLSSATVSSLAKKATNHQGGASTLPLLLYPHNKKGAQRRWTSSRITTTKTSDDTDTTGEDSVNDHGIDELLEQPRELVQAAGELAFVVNDNLPDTDTASSEATSSTSSTLRGGGTASSTALSLPPPLPTVRNYLKFALPCLGLWVAGPLLSLVDTAFVGLSSKEGATSAQQLAALGPATTLYVSCFVVLFF